MTSKLNSMLREHAARTTIERSAARRRVVIYRATTALLILGAWIVIFAAGWCLSSIIFTWE